MPSVWPGSFDNFVTSRADNTSQSGTHATEHNSVNDALNKLEAEIGQSGAKGTDASIAARLARMDSAALAALGTTPQGSDATVAARLARLDAPVVNVKNPLYGGGASGYPADDTAAIQAAFTAAAAGAVPGEVVLPGKFKITAPIDIPFHALGGIKIKGSGRYGSIIEQATANTPIFRAQTDLTHSVHISDLTLQYATQAGVGDTNSYGIQWTNAGSVTGGFFNWVLERVNIDKAYIAMGIKSPVAGTLPVWGLRASDCKLTNIRQSAIVLTSDVAIGQPRILFQNLYVSNDSSGIVPGGDCIILTACSDAVIDNWELSSWANRALNVSAANTPLNLRAIHVESHSFTGAAPFLFLVTNGGANFQGVSIAGTSNASSFAIMFRADSSGEIYADGVSSAVTVNSERPDRRRGRELARLSSAVRQEPLQRLERAGFHESGRSR
jgi:hypothetical protein